MNFLKRVVTASQLSHPSRPSRKCGFLLRSAGQSSMYSTTYRVNNPQPGKPRTTAQNPQYSSPPQPSSSLTWSQRVKRQAEALTNWPRPSEIPYQAKVANLVNLVGRIATPVKFVSTPEGKHLAGAVIAQEKLEEQSFFIPAVFEGDLAHVAASHVKEDDCVYVEGKLSEVPLPFALIESQGNFHVVVENINFVEGFEKKPPGKRNVVIKQKTFVPGLGNDDSLTTQETGYSEPKISAKTAKDGDHWRDLVNNPSEWRDYREQKAKGLVKAKYPDFKRKDTSDIALWLNGAPQWALQGLKVLAFDVQGAKKKSADRQESWKNLVENPSKWWDNRLDKKSAKTPDFKHRETGEALWLGGSPSWVLAKLPPLKEPGK